MCHVAPALEVEKDVLWDAWKAWCAAEGRDRPGTKAVFARDLRATAPGLTSVRPRDGDGRSHVWRGIGIKSAEQWELPLTSTDHRRFRDAGQGWSGVARTVRPTPDAALGAELP
jgi:putative DNA primase/helicase